MKALISLLLGAWLFVIGTSVQADTDRVFTRAEIDRMLAPIALYPDTVLSHILIASTYPLEVVEAERWIRKNPHLKGEDAVNAAYEKGWDPSVAALTAFPDILQRMSEDIEWTQDLGEAFLADEGRVMDAIQNLREKAYASGHLRKMKHVKVHRENQIIILEPASERVVYIPYYDTRVVYGNWWWDYPPVYWSHPASYVYVSGFYWGPRISLGHGFFFSAFHWPQRRIVVIDRHHHHPHFYSARKIAHYHDARHWHHDPVHRRNVVYRSEPVRVRYANLHGRNLHNEHRTLPPRRAEPPREVRRDDRAPLARERDRDQRREHLTEQRNNREKVTVDHRREGLPNRDRPNRAEEVRERLGNRGSEQRSANQGGDRGQHNPGQWRNRGDGEGAQRTPNIPRETREKHATTERRDTTQAPAQAPAPQRTKTQAPQRERSTFTVERRQDTSQRRESSAPARETQTRRDYQSVPRAESPRPQRQEVPRQSFEQRRDMHSNHRQPPAGGSRSHEARPERH